MSSPSIKGGEFLLCCSSPRTNKTRVSVREILKNLRFLSRRRHVAPVSISFAAAQSMLRLSLSARPAKIMRTHKVIGSIYPCVRLFCRAGQ